MKAVFYFDFFNGETDRSTTYAFNIDLLNADLNFDFDESYEEHCANTESDYGVHDWSSRPDDAVIGFGYTSYEVEPENYLKVMQLWRDYFVSRSDVQSTTEIVEISSELFEDLNDLGVYDEVIEELS
jgi:hypothetical protein